MYIWVVLRSLWPASSWMARAEVSLQKTPSDPINPSFAVTQWAWAGKSGARTLSWSGKMLLGVGDAKRKMHLITKKATVELELKATLPDERSGGGGHPPQETRRRGR